MPSNNGYQPLINSSSSSSSHTSSSSHRPYRPRFLDEICADGTAPPSLKLGDKVVWLSDDGPEYGVVKWLGKLTDVGNEWMAGVDFFNPIGSGTGLYHDYKLFETKMNHASLVPIAGLIRANDYIGNYNNINSSNSKNADTILVAPLKPKRTKKTETSKFYTNEYYHTNLNKDMIHTNDDLEKRIKFSDNIGLHSSSSNINSISNDLAELNFTNVIQAKTCAIDANFDKSSPLKCKLLKNFYITFFFLIQFLTLL